MAVRLILSAVGRSACHQQNVFKQLLPAACSTAQSSLQAGAGSASTLLHQATSSFHSSSSAASSVTLSSLLNQEIKHEQTTYEKDELVAKGPPAPFTLHSQLGDTAVSLTREYNDEKISVDCSVNMQDSLALGMDDVEEDEMEAEDQANDVNFNVTVTKGDKALVFECISDGTYVDIRHISLEPAEGLESETAYTGPVFAELDQELQDGFRSYIQERGVNEDLGEYLRHLMYDKEQQEYVHWLEGVRGFVGAGSK